MTKLILKDIFIYNFLNKSPLWYKNTILFFLILNPILFFLFNSKLATWIFLFEFIFTLTMTLKCYPLISGGLLTLEAIAIGMTNTEKVTQEIVSNQEIILFLIFMITSINCIKELLLFVFHFLLFNKYTKKFVSIIFCIISAFLSAFFDALIVMIIIITAIYQFYLHCNNILLYDKNRNYLLKRLRAYLRNIVMQAAFGSTLGGIMTISGEPQNLIIAKIMHWNFLEFFFKMAPVSIPVFIFGIITSIFLEYFKIFGYGKKIPYIFENMSLNFINFKDKKLKIKIYTQLLIIIWLVFGLTLNIAKIEIIALSSIILICTFSKIDEFKLKKASSEAFPFITLLIIFFIVSSIILEQKIFHPILNYLFSIKNISLQFSLFYFFNGLLSSFSDNIFVSSISMNEIEYFFKKNLLNEETYQKLALIVNIGTNLPSIATPNGQSSLLFLLTSNLASCIKLSYKRMIIMSSPFALIIIFTGLFSIFYL